MTNIASECRSANIARDHAMILPDDATPKPDGIFGKHRTQTPVETLNRGWGSCRDLAVLLIEAARSLGFGARVVTGYLYNPSVDSPSAATSGAGTTHAWADIYVPGAGWIAYDPTNGTIGGGDLIRVAVTRDISQAVPIAGSFVGTSDSYLGMTVDISMVSENRGMQG
jgi:transglutaminase-like putative cysteine protease